MRTLIISDLHLGSRGQADLLRRPELRAVLLDELRDVDRLVLLGDVLELRHGPHRDAVQAARGLFEDLGRVMAGREVVVVAGNHDHPLVGSWLAARGARERPPALAPEQRFSAAEASPMMARLAEYAGPAQVTVAYPGLWLRPDVYALHGHYLDCHLTVPTLERLSIGVMARVMGRPADTIASVDDYEAITAPLFAWIDAAAQRSTTSDTLNGQATVGAWRALRPRGRRSPRQLAVAGAFPLAVAAINRAGLGPVRAEVSLAELRRAGVRAMGEVATRLDLGAGHVIYGHTHRSGPGPADHAAAWTAPCGARLVNSGSWSLDRWFLGEDGRESPYWPGVGVLVEDQGPPVLRQLLAHLSRREIDPSL